MHVRRKDWNEITLKVSQHTTAIREAILAGEEYYQELLQLWTEHANDDQAVADQLWMQEILNQGDDPATTPADADMLGMTTDAKAALIAVLEIYQALTNQPPAQADRAADMRKMA